MAKRWKHWVRVVHGTTDKQAEAAANDVIASEDFDVVVPRLASCVDEDYVYTTILLCFRKQVEVDE